MVSVQGIIPEGRWFVCQSHWKVERTELAAGSIYGRLDTSPAKSGKVCPIYNNDPPILISNKALMVAMATPFYVVGTIAFNLIKIIPTICYLTGKIFYDYKTQDKNEERNSLSFYAREGGWLVLKETGRSLFNAIRAPFYGIAFFFAALYTLVDPFNGEKLVAFVEYHWNHCIDIDDALAPTLTQPYDSKNPRPDIRTCQSDLKKLTFVGENPLYLPGCFQPIAYAKQEKRTVDGVETLYWDVCDQQGNSIANRSIKETHKACTITTAVTFIVTITSVALAIIGFVGILGVLPMGIPASSLFLVPILSLFAIDMIRALKQHFLSRPVLNRPALNN